MGQPLTSEATGTVLIVGGYGLVGELIARQLRQRHPSLSLVIGGRSLEKANACAASLGSATAVSLDISAPDPLAAINPAPDLVVGAVNDEDDRLLMACVRRGIAFVDITRWSERTAVRDPWPDRSAHHGASRAGLRMDGGAVATATAQAARAFSRIDTVMLDILFSLSDQAGPDSLAAADRLTSPIPVWIDGMFRMVRPLSDPRTVRFASGRRTRTWRYDTPDQITNAFTLGARRVESRINYDNPWPIRLLRPLLITGVWRVLESPRLKSLRRALLYSPGKGGQHEVRVEIEGVSNHGALRNWCSVCPEPRGQAHLTASGAVNQVERCLGLNGRVRPPVGVSFPENAVDLAAGITALRQMGVMVALTSAPAPA